jgi:hypothetical protein
MQVKVSKFLKKLAKTGAINRSRRTFSLGRNTLRALRRNPEIEARICDALETFREKCEKSIDKRAFEGVDEPIYFEGEVVGHKKKYSDALAMFRLRGLAPETYSEKHQHVHEGEVQHTVKVYIPQNQRDPQLTSSVPGPAAADLPVIDVEPEAD